MSHDCVGTACRRLASLAAGHRQHATCRPPRPIAMKTRYNRRHQARGEGVVEGVARDILAMAVGYQIGPVEASKQADACQGVSGNHFCTGCKRQGTVVGGSEDALGITENQVVGLLVLAHLHPKPQNTRRMQAVFRSRSNAGMAGRAANGRRLWGGGEEGGCRGGAAGGETRSQLWRQQRVNGSSLPCSRVL
jgi:hypothetical protein